MNQRFEFPRRFSAPHLILVHLMVALTALPPGSLMAGMLHSNVLGGGGGSTGTPAANAPGTAAPVDPGAASAQAQSNAQSMLLRNMQSVQAVNAMQEAARAAAAAANNAGINPNFPGQTLPDVPDGLTAGGLQLKNPGSFTGALTPQESLKNARTIVEIQQTQQQAMLEWTTFNVGRNTEVYFNQTAGGSDAASWIAFNRVTDPSGNPTQILGSIRSEGQVYIINQNGIIFGGASTVNTQTLVASALPINDNLITRGLLNNPDSQFLFSATAQAAGTKGPTPAYTPPAPPASGRIGNVTVQAGARITAPTSAANVGGRVALIGPNVTNEGTISTPDGQTILAAGMQVGFDAHSTADPSLRGLDVYVGSVGTYGGTATNNGVIEASRGSIVIAGKNVHQNGYLGSTTSAALNGRIDLLANYNAVPNINYNASLPSQGGPFVYSSGNSTGIVSTGIGSVMQILPEYGSSLKVVGTELALKSQINMQGLAVHLGQSSVVLAPNANVAISAGVWDLVMATNDTRLDFVNSTGQVYLDQGAVVDVAGSTAVSSLVSQYIITVDLRAAELADSPLIRNSVLRGSTITVDMRERGVRADGTEWVGTPLADLTGYLNVIERNVGQLTTAGGTVTMNAGDSVVMQKGSVVNVSGGYQDFASGVVQTTRLVKDGNFIHIAKANADVIYDGIFSPGTTVIDPRWGVTMSSDSILASNTRTEAAHVFGGNGGSVELNASAMALDGSFVGHTITGPQQLSSAPARSSLGIHFRAQQLDRVYGLFYPSPTPPEVRIRTGASGLAAADAFSLTGAGAPEMLRQDRRDHVVLSPELLSSQGFGLFTLENSDGNIVLPAGETLAASAGGRIVLHGANLDIQGSILAPGGEVELEAHTISPYTAAFLLKLTAGSSVTVPPADFSRGRIILGGSAVVSTGGLYVNNLADSPTALATVLQVGVIDAATGATHYLETTGGGSINIHGHVVEIANGALVDVSGGLVAQNSIVYGDAGSLSIKAGNDAALEVVQGGHLTLGGTLRGLSGSRGGSLTLQAPVIQVGGTASYAGTLLLQPEFFSSGGFSSFVLSGLGVEVTHAGGQQTFAPGVVVSPGTVVRPVVSRLQASISHSGAAKSILLSTWVPQEGLRDAASITLQALGLTNFADSNRLAVRGLAQVGAGSVIETDALGQVTINAQTVDFLGRIYAPGGTVSITAASHYPTLETLVNPLATVHLGSSSSISTVGKTVLLPDLFGKRSGHVHGGGTITVSGNIVAQTGAVLDVSGTAGILDLAAVEAGFSLGALNSVTQLMRDRVFYATRVESDGGLISLNGGDFLYSNATLTGLAGGSTAQGGALSVQSGRFVPSGTGVDGKDITLLVAQDMSRFARPVFGSSVVGAGLADNVGGFLQGIGYFGANTFAAGGFDSLRLGGNVQFVGDVNITASAFLQVADGGVVMGDGLARLAATYVALGRPITAPIRDEEMINPFKKLSEGSADQPSYFGPTYGSGRLEVVSELMDVGVLSLQNIGQAGLTARQDLRGSGYLDIAGHLTLTAGQIYPVTASTFTITAYNYSVGGVAANGSVTIASSGVTPEFPLSGGGRLSIYASTITQAGTLRAPFGTIRLGWDGTGTAPKGLVTNVNVPVAQQVTLGAESVTSVSAIDATTGEGVRIPYGTIKDGTNWIDPTGFDITATGVADKAVRVSGTNITTQAGSVIDIRGGGELYGYRWVEGNGGSTDILTSDTRFAILPGYSAAFSPLAAFATSGLFVGNLGGDRGYVNGALGVGDKVFLRGNSLIAEGSYTLLPARYALLPGAFLVTPGSGDAVDSYVKAGGAVLTSGYRYNSLNPTATGSATAHQVFEVAPLSVVKARAEYVDYSATTFIPEAQQRLNLPVSLTPLDAGYALLSAQQNMLLNGGLMAAGATGARGGRVDISSPLDIVVGGPGTAPQAGKLVLNSVLLSGWNAESLLIGGERSLGAGNPTVTVRTTNLTLDNAGSALTGADIVLVAKENLTLMAGSALRQTGAQTAADTFVVSGNGTLVRVSGVASAQITRTGVTTSALPQLVVNSGASVSGAGIILDSTHATTLSSEAILSGQSISLSSGRLSLLLEDPGTLEADAGMILTGGILAALQQAGQALSLTSYSTFDVYGVGSFITTGSLALQAPEIRGFNQGTSDVVNIHAKNLLLGNFNNGGATGVVAAMAGTLKLTADNSITIAAGAMAVSRFSTVNLTAPKGLLMQGVGSLRAQGNLEAVTPFVSAASNATQMLAAGGALTLSQPDTLVSPASLGLGAQVSFEGARVTMGTDVLLPSGLIQVRALSGDVTVGRTLDVGGVAKQFFDAVRHTNAGQISLSATGGGINLTSSSKVNVGAATAGGNAGLLQLSATGVLALNGQLLGQAAAGTTGKTEIDVGMLASFAELNDALNVGFFNESRSIRVRSGSVTVDGTVNAHRFLLGVDRGSITVNGTINAAGQTGGRIDLIASDNVVLNSGARLTVAAQDFDNAGKGGAVWLESGSYVRGDSDTTYTPASTVLNIASGSTIDLSVAASNAGSAGLGRFTGTLHLRAPQSAGNTEVLSIQAVGGSIVNASNIVVEGYQVFDLTGSGVITSTVQNNVRTNGSSFGGNSAAITARLLNGRADDLSALMVVMPGAEIINRSGSLVLGSTTSAASSDWNLATFRYGPKNAPGVLTLRAAGNLEFYNTLSDGFTVGTTGNAVERMWLAGLSTQNSLVPVNAQSWSYRMAAGADFTAANFREVRPLSGLAADTGSLLLGKDAGQARPTGATGGSALTRLAINPSNFTNNADGANRFQVIRTGTGDIEIFTGRDVRLLNQFATIYTAGVALPNPTQVVAPGDFSLPVLPATNTPDPGSAALGVQQQIYPAQYSRAGGNVSVGAQADIIHLTRDATGLIADSSRQLPNNWLMRRGYLDGSTGAFGGVSIFVGASQQVSDPFASTTWWVDFSNFFDGVGALGGGNVLLNAGRNVTNVSAHAPTNARAAQGVPDATRFVELGGGDVTVIAGANIDAGIYYVERGQGVLNAGGQITTNATRSPSLGLLTAANFIDDPRTWLPTTLFVGKSSFKADARGDLLLGPAANTFLLPQGGTNKHWYKTYFNTYSADSSVSASSLGGTVTLRQAATLRSVSALEPLLGIWMRQVLRMDSTSAAFYQPWIRMLETDATAFFTYASVRPSSLYATSYSGNVNVVGNLNLFPSPQGTLELLAAGSVNGLNSTGLSTIPVPGQQVSIWGSSTINLSDASPATVPGILSPYSYFEFLSKSTNNNLHRTTNNTFLSQRNVVFAETGSTSGKFGVIQAKQALHAAGVLHAADTSPVRIYAVDGDVSGITVYAGKSGRVLAGRDVTDIGLYLQNVRSTDVSLVSAGRDLVAYNENSVLRTQAVSSGNLIGAGEFAMSGDIQISGPGTLQVFAGRDLNLGTGSNRADGTGVGITSIGNGRNPYLPFAGADVIVAAGMGGAAVGLGGSNGQFDGFINALLDLIAEPLPGAPAPALDPGDKPVYKFDTRRYLAELAEALQKDGLGNLPASILVHDEKGPVVEFGEGIKPVSPVVKVGPSSPADAPEPEPTYANSINLNDPTLTAEQRNQLGLALYFTALREAGRDRNNPDSPDVNTYTAGYEAIMKLFPVADVIDNKGTADPADDEVITPGIDLLKDRARPIPGHMFSGNIETQARDIRTKSGGDISIFTPGGGLQLAATLIGDTLAPPGVITESGGDISIFADRDISIGIARIFTLRGGDVNIWSTVGNIAAGSSSKTVQSAPPTRVLIDPQSANVVTDLAGLATGGGIGVLATVAGVAPGNVDLVAPVGAVDAGDAGIRATGNLNIAAAIVLNAGNIAAGGSTSGTPSTAVASPSLASVSSANNATAANNGTSAQAAEQAKNSQQAGTQETPSIISVEVIGYGGGAGDDDEEERKRRRNQPGE